ncbi:hypothetical protein EV126DRAFT_62999 [Verticillium dahliae]|nr:hypothetical protein EV126DRAFT_62999 [Verticillium dahliae]
MKARQRTHRNVKAPSDEQRNHGAVGRRQLTTDTSSALACATTTAMVDRSTMVYLYLRTCTISQAMDRPPGGGNEPLWSSSTEAIIESGCHGGLTTWILVFQNLSAVNSASQKALHLTRGVYLVPPDYPYPPGGFIASLSTSLPHPTKAHEDKSGIPRCPLVRACHSATITTPSGPPSSLHGQWQERSVSETWCQRRCPRPPS